MRRASKRIVSTVCYNNKNKNKKKPTTTTAMKKLYNTAQKIKYNSLKLGSFDDIQLA